jgi:2-succinyl-5-enolpyruvyl-6-hydroxy-3-cyclohexene-1-carboxylate synthase
VARQVSVQATFCATLVDEWARGGVTDAVICPGSRSTPLAVALAERLRVHVRLDERSAAFYAIGLAMASGTATVICTTSGTAAAELHPAVVEAHHAGIALIVCTCDRPPELQNVGASQTIDQVGLFTTSPRWAENPGVPDDEQRQTWRPLARRALAESLTGPHGPGPVHLNVAFREPLIGEAGPLPERPAQQLAPSTSETATPPTAPRLGGRGLIIAGAHAAKNPTQLLALGQSLGWPVLADPPSGARLPGTVAAADAIVRTDVPLPMSVLLLGTPWLSKALSAYVERAAAAGARVIAVDPYRRFTDPTRVVTEFHHVDPDVFITEALAAAAPGDPEWQNLWHSYEERAQAAIDAALADDLSEPLVARRLTTLAAQHDAAVMVSASMPMRDLEWFAPALAAPPRVFSNRGANGIDGVVSTAFGLAAGGRRTVALLGDLAFLHDVSGLVNLPEVPCTFVVPDNGGGGIFSFLPQSGSLPAPTFERLFGTPPTSDIAQVASGFGLEVHDVKTSADFDAALSLRLDPGRTSPALIRVRVPSRAENVAIHEALNQAVRQALL